MHKNKFQELCQAYHAYLEEVENYHNDCAGLIDKLRYQLLAFLECPQDTVLFRTIQQVDKAEGESGPQAKPLMQFNKEDGFWHIGMMLQLPHRQDPERKGKVWLQVLIKKMNLKAKQFTVKLNIKPVMEQKVPDEGNEGQLTILCEAIYNEAKRFYNEEFMEILAKNGSAKTIGFQISE